MESSYLHDTKIDRLNVADIKRYLKRHNQFITGKKAVLIERAKGVSKLRLKDCNNVERDDIDSYCRRREEKLLTPLGEKIPDPSQLTDWTLDLCNIPEFTDNDIYNYLVLGMKAKRQLRSKIYFEDRHVHSVEFSEVSDVCSHGLVRAKVIPSLPSANQTKCPDHSVWVCLSKVTGKVHSADCDCTAGTGEACNHIAALLYAIADINDKKKDGTLASTSKKCLWNNPRKRKLSPKKSQDVMFKKYKLNSLSVNEGEVLPKSEMDTMLTKSSLNIDRMRERLEKTNCNAGWLTLFQTEQIQEDIPVIPNLVDISFNYCDNVDLNSEACQNNFKGIFNNLTISDEETKFIEKNTKQQAKCELWKQARQQRLTSSLFGKIMLKKSETKPDNLIKDILGYVEINNKFVKWGRDHEPAARRKYLNTYKNDFKDFFVCKSGLVVNSDYPYLGASPDGLVNYIDGNNEEMNGVLEIKCPAAIRWKTVSPLECSNDPKFYCKNISGQVKLKESHPYYFQVQGVMHITQRKWCDFVVWTLAGMSVERINYDSSLCNVMISRLEEFYIKFLIPELFTERVKRGIPLY